MTEVLVFEYHFKTSRSEIVVYRFKTDNDRHFSNEDFFRYYFASAMIEADSTDRRGRYLKFEKCLVGNNECPLFTFLPDDVISKK